MATGPRTRRARFGNLCCCGFALKLNDSGLDRTGIILVGVGRNSICYSLCFAFRKEIWVTFASNATFSSKPVSAIHCPYTGGYMPSQKRHRVPDDFSRRGMEIVKLKHTIERVARIWTSTVTLMVRCGFDRGVWGQIVFALRSGQSLAKKMERLGAVIQKKIVAEFHSVRYMNDLG